MFFDGDWKPTGPFWALAAAASEQQREDGEQTHDAVPPI